MNPQTFLLPAVPLVLVAIGWWGSGNLVSKLVKPQSTPVVTQITLPPGIESLTPDGPRPPLGYLELAAFGFTEPPAPVPLKSKVLIAADFFVVDSVLLGQQLHTATIGNRVVKVGDKLNKKYTVVAITRDGVWVRGPGKRAEQERIGFRPFDTSSTKSVAAVTDVPANKSVPAGAAKPIAADQRDFRQILELLKL